MKLDRVKLYSGADRIRQWDNVNNIHFRHSGWVSFGWRGTTVYVIGTIVIEEYEDDRMES